jgi:hypothetical protein
MPDHDELHDRRLEDRLRRALRWMAEDADGAATPTSRSIGTRATGIAGGDAGDAGDAGDDGLYLDEPATTPSGRRTSRTLVLAAAALIILVALAVPIGLVVAGGGSTHGSESEGTTGIPDPTAKAQVLSALSATTSADNWDISYTYGENAGAVSVPPSTSTSVPCAASSTTPGFACSAEPGDASIANVTVTGTGVINVNPKAMVTIANVSNFGHVVLRIDSSQVWEELSGDSGGLAPDPGESDAGGQSLPGYSGLVEGTLGTREGAVAMLGIASPTGYLELDEQAIVGVTPAGTGTVNGQAVTDYKISVKPSELAADPTASTEQVSAIQAALATLDKAGMSGTVDQVAVDAQGFIVQSISTYQFRDGGSVTVRAEFSNFGCAGTVLMPGQTDPTPAASGCVSPDTPAVAATSTTTTSALPTTTTSLSPSNAIVPGAVTTTSVPPNGGSTTTTRPTGSPSTVTVPNVLGESPAQASAALLQAGLQPQFVGTEGRTVTSEAPTAGSTVPEHSDVVLTSQ